ncbi:vitamin B12 ABC transporter substrate-binding protein BtuF [Entomohabitans teleogrylli]|uniref:vitamin B12 ABC transporter substrate-binding protein BtuF n=1 Tax=Entomohabitans teleogrylli TaxID=1384589 RepID=UPI00073D8878|nr:vitamin B12 ABC transporter substrate-binding protein BtuF [Entomohabitans teleogrylli]
MARNLLQRALCALLLLIPAWLCAAPRVISLSPGNTELAFAAGITPIAVSSRSDYPPQAQQIEQVANWQGLNLERIIALKPDVILAWRGGNPERPIRQLEAMGIQVLWLDPNSIGQVIATIRQLAAWSPDPQQAERSAAQLERQYLALKARAPHQPARRVFLQFGQSPMFTSNGASLQNEVLALCGGQNIFADSTVPWPQVSREQVLSRKPQAIILPGDVSKIPAVKNFWHNQLDIPVIAVKDDWFERASPRIILAAKQVCESLAALP